MCHGPPLRAVMVCILSMCALAFPLLLPHGALAGGVDGSGVPSAGGGFAGPGDPGARGAIYNPAAIGRGEGIELLVDLGMFRQELRTTLDDLADLERGVYYLGQPSAALAVPIGLFAVGGFVHGPYSRGSDDNPDGERRFLSIGSDLQLVEGALLGSLSTPVTASGLSVTLSGGLRIGQVSFRSDSALDFGYFLNDLLVLTGSNYALPVGDPFLEGQQRVGPLSGVGTSWMAGLSVDLPGGAAVHAAFRPRWVVPLRGGFELQPSNDLNTVVEGDARVGMPFPARAMLAASVPVGRLTLLPEVEWIDWGGAADIGVTLQDLAITSSDPLFDGILESAGLDRPSFLAAAEGDQPTSLGWKPIVNPGIQAEYALTDTIDVRGGFFWGRTAVPDSVVTPSNVDFETFTVRTAGAWRASRRFRFAATVEAFPSPVRVISGLEPANPTVPSGNGRYQLILWRAGLTAQLFLSSREESP